MPEGISIYIVEDEALARAALEAIVEDLNYTLKGSAADADIALLDIISTKPDILLLDINLGADRDGVWLAQQLQASSLQVKIIYLTAYGDAETLRRVKETKPSAYLKKPYDETTLCTTIDLLSAQISSDNSKDLDSELENESIVVQDGRKKIRIELSKLLYIQSDGNYVRLGLKDATYFIRASLKWYVQNLPSNVFIQIHRSTLVNKNYISSTDTNSVNVQSLNFKTGSSFNDNLSTLL